MAIAIFISRRYIKENRNISFVYADSFRSNEYQGHASLCAGEPNAYGIPTCKCFNMAPDDANWNDSKDFDFIKIYIKKAIDKIPKNKPIVVLSGVSCPNFCIHDFTSACSLVICLPFLLSCIFCCRYPQQT